MAGDLTVGLDMIAAATVPTKPSARLLWGVVTSTASPVQVVLENDASATSRPVSGNAAGPVVVGDRVLLARQRRRLTIMANPSASTAAAGRRWGGTAQVIPTAVTTQIEFSGGSYDYVGGVSGASGGMTVPAAGIYTLTGAVRWGASATGVRQVRVMVGSSAVAFSAVQAINGAAHMATATMRLAAGDQVTLYGYQSSGADLALDPTFGTPSLSVALVARV